MDGVSIVLAVGAALLAAVIVVFGATRIFRRRRITLVDYPELPAPPPSGKMADTASGGSSPPR